MMKTSLKVIIFVNSISFFEISHFEKVDRIVAEKSMPINKATSQTSKFYLIKWLGHSDAGNTWEPHHHVSDQVDSLYT